jgi:hypothetical protein
VELGLHKTYANQDAREDNRYQNTHLDNNLAELAMVSAEAVYKLVADATTQRVNL